MPALLLDPSLMGRLEKLGILFMDALYTVHYRADGEEQLYAEDYGVEGEESEEEKDKVEEDELDDDPESEVEKEEEEQEEVEETETL